MTNTINTTDEWIWTDWHGGKEPPVDQNVDVITDGKHLTGMSGKAAAFDWKHVKRYAILNPHYVALVAPDYPALLKMAVDALEKLKNAWPSTSHGPTKNPTIQEQRVLFAEVNATLEAIRKAIP